MTASRRLRDRSGRVALGAAIAVALVALPAVALALGPGWWETRERTGSARQELSYVTAAGAMFLAGGGTRHQRYDPVADRWTDVAPLPTRLDHIQGVTVSGKIYYVGGLKGWPSPHADTVYEYDPVKDTFTSKARMPRGRGAGGVAVHDGRIYYAGGLADGVAVPWFDVYDPAKDTWTQLPPMPTARDHFHAVVADGRFWAIGGRNREIRATTSANEAYDFTTGRWTTGHAPLPTPRGGFAAAVNGDEILIIGGESYGKAHGDVEAYDVERDSWRLLSRMPTARHGIQAAVCQGGVYIAGGGIKPGHAPVDTHEVFFPDGAARACGQDGTPPAPTPTQTPAATPTPTRPVAQVPAQPTPEAPARAPLAPDAAQPPAPDASRPTIRVQSLRWTRGDLQVRVELSKAARVELRLQRAVPGRRSGGRCRTITRRNAHRRPCRRHVAVRSATTQAQRGAGSSVITLRSPRLSAGRYRCVAVATDAAGLSSRPAYAPLRVARRPR